MLLDVLTINTIINAEERMVKMEINTLGIWLLVAIIVILVYQNFLLRLDLNTLSTKHNQLADIVCTVIDGLAEIEEEYNPKEIDNEEINENKVIDKL